MNNYEQFYKWMKDYLNKRCPVGDYKGLNPLDIENIRAELNKVEREKK